MAVRALYLGWQAVELSCQLAATAKELGEKISQNSIARPRLPPECMSARRIGLLPGSRAAPNSGKSDQVFVMRRPRPILSDPRPRKRVGVRGVDVRGVGRELVI